MTAVGHTIDHPITTITDLWTSHKYWILMSNLLLDSTQLLAYIVTVQLISFGLVSEPVNWMVPTWSFKAKSQALLELRYF